MASEDRVSFLQIQRTPDWENLLTGIVSKDFRKGVCWFHERRIKCCFIRFHSFCFSLWWRECIFWYQRGQNSYGCLWRAIIFIWAGMCSMAVWFCLWPQSVMGADFCWHKIKYDKGRDVWRCWPAVFFCVSESSFFSNILLLQCRISTNCSVPVSYTHLDVYKRQSLNSRMRTDVCAMPLVNSIPAHRAPEYKSVI